MPRAAHDEFLTLHDLLEDLIEAALDKDVLHYIWNSTEYTSSKFHKHHFAAITPPDPFLWIWKSKCIPRIKFNTWLLFVDWLNTRGMPSHKFLEEGYNCVTCQDEVEETSMHLFFECSASGTRWFALGF
jgi:hypothetical protein